MKFVLIFTVFFTIEIFAQSQGDESPNVYGKQCAESSNGQCIRYHYCRSPREGEEMIIECQCYKSWADRYPDMWGKIVSLSQSKNYISIGVGSNESLAREDAKNTCNILFENFLRDFVEDSNIEQAYEVSEEHCSMPFVCENEE